MSLGGSDSGSTERARLPILMLLPPGVCRSSRDSSDCSACDRDNVVGNGWLVVVVVLARGRIVTGGGGVGS